MLHMVCILKILRRGRFKRQKKTDQEIGPKLKRNLTVDKYENKRLLRSDLLNDPE